MMIDNENGWSTFSVIFILVATKSLCNIQLYVWGTKLNTFASRLWKMILINWIDF